jgi:16S rRNA (cytosine967-C5)-methyltransferase
MSKFHSHINSAGKSIESYSGEEPFASYLKKFFSLNKKYGSKDRKQISHLCYCHFRIGKLKEEQPVEDRILTGLFLCSSESSELLQELRPEWNEKIAIPVKEKLALLQLVTATDIFSFTDELSNGIEKEPFILSHLQQPNLFLRLRPGKGEKVKQQLGEAGIGYVVLSDTCLVLQNAAKVDSVIMLNKDAVVQDYSSQRTGESMQSAITNLPAGRQGLQPSITAWDCCAASGGKSIMLCDLHPGIDLTVSDIRESILVNLKKRFSEAGIAKYKSMVADLTRSKLPATYPPFNLVIADVPCSGSGTWGRTPENLLFVESRKIDEYASLQKKIVSNVIPHLAPGGYFLYITCSVFKKENEDAVDFIQQNSGLQLVKMEILKGYDKKADTLFVALLRLP